jgi:hypothetical protein
MIQMDNLVKLQETVAPPQYIVTIVSVLPLFLAVWLPDIRLVRGLKKWIGLRQRYG